MTHLPVGRIRPATKKSINVKQTSATGQRMGNYLIIAAVSMDNLTVVATSAKRKDDFSHTLAKEYDIKRLGEHNIFLGCTVQRN